MKCSVSEPCRTRRYQVKIKKPEMPKKELIGRSAPIMFYALKEDVARWTKAAKKATGNDRSRAAWIRWVLNLMVDNKLMMIDEEKP